FRTGLPRDFRSSPQVSNPIQAVITMHIEKITLEGKTALVTGASSGIGKATAKLFAYAGARVALLGRTSSSLNLVLEEIGVTAVGHLVLEADVSQEMDMTAALAGIAATWGRLDIVVVNAGINGVWAPLGSLTVEEWDKTIDVNLRGTFLTVKSSLPLLKV